MNCADLQARSTVWDFVLTIVIWWEFSPGAFSIH